MKLNTILMLLLLITLVGTATAKQNQQCVNIFATNSDAIIKADVTGNHGIEYKEVVAFINSQTRMDKILNADDGKAVNDYFVLGCGIPQNYLHANQIQTPSQTTKNNLVLGVVFLAIVALIYMRTQK